jgi:hypothetical protein
MNYLFKRANVLLLLLFTNYAFGQLAKQMSVGLVLPSVSSSSLNMKGKTGFEILYGFSAKYSDRLEWNSSVSYIRAPYEIDAYDVEYFPTVYTPVKYKAVANVLNYDYNLSYFVVPDIVALTGGAMIGFTVGNSMKDQFNGSVLFSSEDLTKYNNTTSGAEPSLNKYAPQPDEIFKTFNYGFQVGASATLRDRFKFYALYNIYMNPVFDDEAMKKLSGDPSLRFLRIGFTYKFLPSYKTLRF